MHWSSIGKPKAVETLALSSLEIFGTQLFIVLYYISLAAIMPPADFGQLSALYSLIYFCSSVGSSGISSTLTLLRSNGNAGNQCTPMHAMIKQWQCALPLAALATCAVGFCSLYDSCESPFVLLLLCFGASIATILKKQLNHAARLWNSHLHTVIAELLYHVAYILVLAIIYQIYGITSPAQVLILFNVCTWLFSFGYLYYINQSLFTLPTTTEQDSIPIQHIHRALSELAKVGFSPNAIVLVTYNFIGPDMAGFVKLLHASGQLVFSSLGRLVDTYTHLTYARTQRSVDKVGVVRSAIKFVLPTLITGILFTAVGIAKSEFLQRHVLQYPIAATMFVFLFATNYAENILRFNLFRLGNSTAALKIALVSIGIVGFGLLVGNAQFDIMRLSGLLMTSRIISLIWLYTEGAKN